MTLSFLPHGPLQSTCFIKIDELRRQGRRRERERKKERQRERERRERFKTLM
jgi:hypothetical protein